MFALARIWVFVPLYATTELHVVRYEPRNPKPDLQKRQHHGVVHLPAINWRIVNEIFRWWSDDPVPIKFDLEIDREILLEHRFRFCFAESWGMHGGIGKSRSRVEIFIPSAKKKKAAPRRRARPF